jgi:seryl-tRNA synthetase
MLTLNYIRENSTEAIKRLKIKGFDAEKIIGSLLELDNKKRSLQTELNNKQSEINSISKQIGVLFKEGKGKEAEELKNKTGELKEEIKEYDSKFDEIAKEVNSLLVLIPNIPSEQVPPGNSENDNIEVEKGGEIPKLHEKAMPHWELASKYNIIDFELGNKLTGAGFPVYKGKGAKLQRALISFFLEEAEKAGYEEVLPPFLVNEDSGFGTGQLPDKEGQMYHATEDNLYLIPTAEVPVTNIYRDVIIDEQDLPIKNTAYTPCWRREAGSYGKDVRGLNRLHQFDKVEIVQIQHPDKSYDTLMEMLEHSVGLVKKLGLPYRVLKLCGGDISFTSALTYDIEVYSAAQERWLEVSSVSNFESYQANRLKCRFKGKNTKKATLAHTLNGSALALPRILAAILENNQMPNSIKIPDALKKYLNFEEI